MSKGQNQLLQAALEARRRAAEEARYAKQQQEEAKRPAKPISEPQEELAEPVVEVVEEVAQPIAAPIDHSDTKKQKHERTLRKKQTPQRNRGNPAKKRHEPVEEETQPAAGPLTDQTPGNQRPRPSTSVVPDARWNESDIRTDLTKLFGTVRVGTNNLVVYNPTGVAGHDDEEVIYKIEQLLQKHNLKGRVAKGSKQGKFRAQATGK